VIRPSISSGLSRFVGRFPTRFVPNLILGVELLFESLECGFGLRVTATVCSLSCSVPIRIEKGISLRDLRSGLMIRAYCRDGSNSRCLDVSLDTFFTDRMSHSRPLCYSWSPSRMVPINLPAAVLFSLAAGGGSRNFLGRIEAVATSIRLRSAVAIYCPPGSRKLPDGPAQVTTCRPSCVCSRSARPYGG